MFKKSLALILLTVLVLTSFVIPAYADSVIGEIGTEEMGPIENDRVPLKDSYTEDEIRALLSGDHNFDLPEEGIKFGSENFPLAVDENVTSPDAVDIPGDDYYITVLSSGKILIAPNSTYITTTNYVESEAYMWVFEEVDLLTYAIRNKLNPNTCLAASPSSSGNSAVIKKTYSATDPTCHWSMSMSSNGNYIQSEAVGTNAYGQYLYLSGNQFVLSSTNLTYIGLVDVDWWIPCTAISLGDYISVAKGGTQTFSITPTPSNANLLGDDYMTYTIANTSVCTINVRNKILTGVNIGETTLTVKHKMTGATKTINVYVGYQTKIKAYYDNAFKTLCEDYAEYDNNPQTQIEEWFEKVKKKYATSLNIHLNLIAIEKKASYPEEEFPDGDDPNAPCGCPGTCQNASDAIHHKNIYNMLDYAPVTDIEEKLNVFFTGHNVCSPKASPHDGGNIYGMAFYNEGVCMITVNKEDYSSLSFYLDADCREKFIISTIAHEIGHFFQDPNPNPGNAYYGLDHYGHGNGSDGSMPGPTGNQSNNCIFGGGMDNYNIYNNLTMCPDCTAEIKSNAGRYNHQ